MRSALLAASLLAGSSAAMADGLSIAFTMMSMRSPAAARIFSKGRRAFFSSWFEMVQPWLRSAAISNGQIFMAVMPSASKDCASSSARFRNASRSSRPSAGSSAPSPQFCVD